MTEEQTTAVTKTNSEKFTSMVAREFEAAMNTPLELDHHKRTLAQHMFIKVDTQLKELEIKRSRNPQKKDQPPITWQNINYDKLALDVVHRIDLGLDALIENHIHPIPYLNGRTQKYDLDLRIGYKGKIYYKTQMAIDPPKDVRCQLVYDTDEFVPHMKDTDADVESYEFNITKPFDRGNIIGGFGYIVYDDATKNRLILVQKKRIDYAQSKGNKEFWTNSYDEMAFKTVVTVTANAIDADPNKVGVSYYTVEAEDNADIVENVIAENANQVLIDIPTGNVEVISDPVEDNGAEEDIYCPRCQKTYKSSETPNYNKVAEAIEITGQCLSCHQAEEQQAKGGDLPDWAK